MQDPKPTAWTKSEVNSIVTANFAKTGGKRSFKYVEKRTYPGEVMNGMLVYMADNQAKGSDAAIEFLKLSMKMFGVNGYLQLLRKKSKLVFKI